jgi:hypothetical protein
MSESILSLSYSFLDLAEGSPDPLFLVPPAVSYVEFRDLASDSGPESEPRRFYVEPPVAKLNAVRLNNDWHGRR